MSIRLTLTLAATLFVAACSDTDSHPVETPMPAEAKLAAKTADTPKSNGKEDHWGWRDRPSLFSNGLEYRLEELPREGEAANIPWASSYWPVHEDSLNFKWAGEDTLSTSEKYGKAFDVEDITEKVSKHHGIAKYSDRTECSTDDDCNDKIGEACSKRHGAEKGRCIPTWWGICHAWAPAAILHPEPLRPVTRNGVTFEVNDIKALVTIMNDKAAYKFVSLRCDADDSEGEIEYDQWDRPTGDDIGCKDTNPGTYHVLLTNYLGLQAQSFVEDRTFDNEVWNQPLRGYRITEMTEIDAQQANQLVGVAPEGEFAPKTFDAIEGTVEHEAWHHAEALDVTPGHQLTVTMTGTGDADLHVRFGQQSTDKDYDCRPYDGGSSESCELTIPEDARQVFISVFGYSDDEGGSEFKLETSTRLVSDDPMAGIPTDYKFNDKAMSFRKVKLEVDYITEADSDEPGNLADRIDSYTRTDHYEYVLELDKDGKIHGGEWINGSKKEHPDFLWLPTGQFSSGNGNVAGGAIRKDMVMSLLNESLEPETPDIDPKTGPKVIDIKETGEVAKGDWKHFGPFEATGKTFSVTMTGTGDADLYVRRVEAPTKDDHDCRPYENGSAESCLEAGAATYFVSVHGYTAATFELAITWTEPGEGEEEPEPVEIAHLNETGAVGQGELKTFELDVVAGQLVVIKTTAPNDVDLYIRMNQVPTRAMYDQRAWTASGDETLRYMPTNSGKLFIAVDGYQASDFTLTTANQ